MEVKEVTSISCSGEHSMILTSDGLFSWGKNENGQLGLGHNISQNTPQKVELSSSVRSIVCGCYHSMILTSDGSLFSWGYNSNGQLGLGHENDENKPSKIQFEFGEIMSIGCGWNCSLVLTNNGIFSWGYNHNGTWRSHKRYNYIESKPQKMKWNRIDNFTSIYCFACHFIIFSSEGTFSWGWNKYGQLGQGHNDSSSNQQLIVNGKEMKLKSQLTLMWEFQRIIWLGKISSFQMRNHIC